MNFSDYIDHPLPQEYTDEIPFSCVVCHSYLKNYTSTIIHTPTTHQVYKCICRVPTTYISLNHNKITSFRMNLNNDQRKLLLSIIFKTFNKKFVFIHRYVEKTNNNIDISFGSKDTAITIFDHIQRLTSLEEIADYLNYLIDMHSIFQ